jgi:hypothetical protein
MPLLEPDLTLELPGVRIISIGVVAEADAVPLEGPDAGLRAGASELDEALIRYGFPDRGALALTAALGEQGVRPVLAVPLEDLATVRPGGDRSAFPDEGPAVVLVVAEPDEGEGQVILEVDGAGVLSWHLPVAADGGEGAGRLRSVGEQVFRIPVRQLDLPSLIEDAARERALFGIGVRKLLHVLRYPVERTAGVLGSKLVAAWEGRHRPYGLRFLDDTVASHDGAAPALSRLDALRGGPALLLVHGTFSTAESAFDGLLRDDALIAALRQRYDGRILLFDHPSLHIDPVANARWLLERLPPDSDLVFDVVAHSRGGLVTRALTCEGILDGLSRQLPTVRTVIHVATPNAGTVLASPDHWGTLLDTVTNLATLFPDDTASVPLVAVIEVVKQIGTGILSDLDGLAAMDPAAPMLLTGLSPAAGWSSGQAFTIASDFDPEYASLAVRALDVLADPFFREGNDLVVPTEGVRHAPGLTVEDGIVVPRTPAISHIAYFRDPAVRKQIDTWLP